MAVRDLSGRPVAYAKVVLIFDAVRRLGAEVRKGGDGRAKLTVPASWQLCDAFSVMPQHGLWRHGQRNWALPSDYFDLLLQSLDPTAPTALHRYLQPGKDADGAGVKVAVIDAGLGTHDDLGIASGANLAVGEYAHDTNRWHNNGLGQGTYVTGIVAGRGVVQSAWRGMAPAATLVGAGRKLSHKGRGKKLGLVEQRSPGFCDARRGCGSRVSS